MNNEQNRYHIPRTNVVPMEWTHNYLIPLTLDEFYRKGMHIFGLLMLFTVLCSSIYWIANHIRAGYEQSIFELQSETAEALKKYTELRDFSEEFSELANWKNDPDPGTQYSAISSLLTRNGCFLVQSAFHSGLQDIPDKILDELRTEITRTLRSKADDLKTAGIWNLSLRLPVSGIGTSETRKNIVTALQKEAAESLKPAGAGALFMLTEEQGQNILKNDNSLNAVLYVWKGVK